MPVIELWKYRNRDQISRSAMTMRPDGYLVLGRDVYEAMGEPAAVKVQIDTDKGTVSVRNAEKDKGFGVSARTLQVNLTSALRYAGWTVAEKCQGQPLIGDHDDARELRGVKFVRREPVE